MTEAAEATVNAMAPGMRDEFDPFGPKDYISRLPDADLFEIFKLITKLDLYNMMIVSERMFHIASDKCLDFIKWPGGVLNISKECYSTYSVELQINSNNYPWKDQPKLYKHPWKIHRNHISYKRNFEMRYVKWTLAMLKGKDSAQKESTADISQYEQTEDLTKVSGHHWPMPEFFINEMRGILRHHGVELVRIKGGPYDSEFLSTLLNLLTGHGFEKLHCDFMEIEENSEQTLKCFTQFIKKFKKVNFFATTMNVSIINEDFLLNMHDSNTNHFHCDFRIDNANLFKPKQSILQHLLHFDHLTLSGMTLNVNWVTKFIMMYLDHSAMTKRERGTFKFSTDRLLTSQMISNQISTDYEHKNMVNRDQIVGKLHGFVAIIQSWSRNGNENIVYIQFKNPFVQDRNPYASLRGQSQW